MVEPGLDLHEWETRWEQLLEEAQEAPAETLPHIDRLIEEMLTERGFELGGLLAEDEGSEIVRQFLASHEIARLADAGEADPGDVADALGGYRAIFDYLTEERPGP